MQRPPADRRLPVLLLCLAVWPWSAGRSDAEPGVLRLDESFSDDERADFQAVADDVWRVVRLRMPAAPPAGERPLRVMRRDAGPPLCDAVSNPAEYRIFVNVGQRRYAQFAYQLGHELGHVMLDPRRTHGPAETLAEAVALQTLLDLAERWQEAPPHPHWRDYAPAFTQYARGLEKNWLAEMPPEVARAARAGRWSQVALYLRFRREDQDRRITDRPLNGLAVLALLSGEVAWPDLVGLAGRTHPTADEDNRLRSDLHLPDSALPAWCRRMGRGRRPPLLVVTHLPEAFDPPPASFRFALDDRQITLHEPDEAEVGELVSLREHEGVLHLELRP